MPLRSYADVPNRIVRLFLQEAGRQYDVNRGHPAFGSMTLGLRARFGDRCPYCGTSPAPLVEEPFVPMTRAAVGLHAWGNVVPACKACNDAKGGPPWQDHSRLNE